MFQNRKQFLNYIGKAVAEANNRFNKQNIGWVMVKSGKKPRTDRYIMAAAFSKALAKTI